MRICPTGLEGEESNQTTQNSEYKRHCADFASGSNSMYNWLCDLKKVT